MQLGDEIDYASVAGHHGFRALFRRQHLRHLRKRGAGIVGHTVPRSRRRQPRLDRLAHMLHLDRGLECGLEPSGAARRHRLGVHHRDARDTVLVLHAPQEALQSESIGTSQPDAQKHDVHRTVRVKGLLEMVQRLADMFVDLAWFWNGIVRHRAVKGKLVGERPRDVERHDRESRVQPPGYVVEVGIRAKPFFHMSFENIRIVLKKPLRSIARNQQQIV